MQRIEWCHKKDRGACARSTRAALAPIRPCFHSLSTFGCTPLRVRCQVGAHEVREDEVICCGMRLASTADASVCRNPFAQLFERLVGQSKAASVRISVMATTSLLCGVLKREAEGLDYQPYPGELGHAHLCEQYLQRSAGPMWVAHQTMLINENRLTTIEPKARAFLVAEMEKFLFGSRVRETKGISYQNSRRMSASSK